MLICIPTEGQMRRLSLILSMCDKYEASRSGYLLPPGISRRLDAFPGNCLAIPHKSANCFMLGLLRETFSLFRSHGNSLLTVSILCAKLTLHAARGNLILTWAGSNICKANSFSKMFNFSFQYILKLGQLVSTSCCAAVGADAAVTSLSSVTSRGPVLQVLITARSFAAAVISHTGWTTVRVCFTRID